MDEESIDDLRQALAQARRRAEEAEAQRQQERLRAEQQRERAEEAEAQRQQERQRAEEAEAQRQQERQRAEEAEDQARPTTLPEYIDACHEFLFSNIGVQPDKSLTSKGSIPDPKDKWCPQRLAPWPDFLHHQKETLGKLYDHYPDAVQAFESKDFLRGLGERIRKRLIANEKDVEQIQHETVEAPVTSIIEQLRSQSPDDPFAIGRGIVFENLPNIASDDAEEPAERLNKQQATPHRQNYPRPYQLRADQICVYKYDNDDVTRRRMAFVVEYKPPHKLTLPHMRLGLREMDIFSEVINRTTKPGPEENQALFQYTSDKLTAACVVQTFHYMIEGGLEYSYLTTSEAFVFLKIDWTDPNVLYFHLAEPTHEILAHPENSRHCTAVSQVLAFTLLALGARIHGQDDRDRATQILGTWKEDYEFILHSIPNSDRKQTPPASAFQPRVYKEIDRSPYLLRNKGPSTVSCRPDFTHKSKTQSPETSDDEVDAPETPLAARSRPAPRNASQPRDVGNQVSTPSGSQTRPFCTQKCLLGLFQKTDLDASCPNAVLHAAGDPNCRHHSINHDNLLQLLHTQLMRTLDSHIEPLWRQGSRGIMFKVTLSAFGYTVLGKGTVRAFVEDLRHEADVYARLQHLEGICVPVFLGALDLPRPYYYDLKVCVVHMMFFSWGGNSINDLGSVVDVEREKHRRTQEIVRSLRLVHAAGVLHKDVRAPNMLWDETTQRVFVIDFERARITGPKRRPLQPLPNNSKRKRSYADGKETDLSRGDDLRQMESEVAFARTLLI